MSIRDMLVIQASEVGVYVLVEVANSSSCTGVLADDFFGQTGLFHGFLNERIEHGHARWDTTRNSGV